MKTIGSWIRHLLWEEAPEAAPHGLTARLYIGPAPSPHVVANADLLLVASDIAEAKQILRQLAHLQTVSRVEVR